MNLIDWQAFARTDQLLLREIRDEAAARVAIGLDLSGTMWWPDASVPAKVSVPAKAEVATRVALNIAHLHLRAGDLVEIWMADPRANVVADRCFMPRSPSDVVSVFDRLLTEHFTLASFGDEFAPRATTMRGCDVAIWVGDALGEVDWRRFTARGRRGILLHVLSSLEADIQWIESDISYYDFGLGRKEYQGAVLLHRDNYRHHLAQWQNDLKRQQVQTGGNYLSVTDGTSISQFHHALVDFATAAP